MNLQTTLKTAALDGLNILPHEKQLELAIVEFLLAWEGGDRDTGVSQFDKSLTCNEFARFLMELCGKPSLDARVVELLLTSSNVLRYMERA